MINTRYAGCFVHQIDGKSRVMLPGEWRVSETTFALHLVETPSPHIVAAADPGRPGASPVRLDSAGRIRIPAELRRAAGINQEVLFVGLLDNFALWSPSVYHAHAF